MEHTTNSFVSDQLQETLADIVFKCPLKETQNHDFLYLSLLFEHRSTEYKYVSIQLGGYLFDSYREQVKKKSGPLIPVIPFLYYHGNTRWKPLGLEKLFDKYPSAIIDFIPDFNFLYENIQNYSDDQIRQISEGLLTSSLMIQRYAHKPEKLIKKFQDIFLILNSWERGNLFTAIIAYFLQIVEIDEDQLNKLITQIPDSMKTEFISLADRLTQKGREKGQIEGQNRTNRQVTINMLREGFEVTMICNILDVTPEYVISIRASLSDQESID